MPLTVYRTRKAQLHAKVEASFTSVAGADTFKGMKPSYKPNVEQNVDESLTASFGKPPVIAGGISADLGFSVYLRGSGAAGTAPEIDDALKLCGLKPTVDTGVSVTYQPDTSQNSPGSVSWNADGTLHVVEKCFGNLKISGESGKLVMAEFGYKGAYKAITNTAIVTSGVSFDATSPRPFQSSTIKVSDLTAAGAIGVKSFSVDFGANITLVDDATSSSAYDQAFYGDRNIVGNVVFTGPSIATLNSWLRMTANTAGEFSFQWGGTAGNIIQVKMPSGVITNVTPSDDNGRYLLSVDFQASLGGVEGTDFSLIYT